MESETVKEAGGMWEAVNGILNGENSLQTLATVVVIVVLAMVLIKNDYLRIKTAHVKIGTDEKERAVIRQQIEWSSQYIEGLYGVIMEMYPRLDKFKTRYILERIYDEVVNWISFNHITRSDMYIMVKQEKLRSVVYSIDVDKVIKTAEFKDVMDEWTKIIVNRLVDIREYYSK